MFENTEKTLIVMLLAIGGKAETKKQFFFTVTFQKIFQNFSVNAQCLSEIEGT